MSRACTAGSKLHDHVLCRPGQPGGQGGGESLLIGPFAVSGTDDCLPVLLRRTRRKHPFRIAQAMLDDEERPHQEDDR
jgi:hypothetical protein